MYKKKLSNPSFVILVILLILYILFSETQSLGTFKTYIEPLLILWFLATLIIHCYEEYVFRNNLINSLSFLEKLNFKKVDSRELWSGIYRNRTFNLSLKIFRPTKFAHFYYLRIDTLNKRNNLTLKIQPIDYKNKTIESKYSYIAPRIESLGLFSKFSTVLPSFTLPNSILEFFVISEKQTYFLLPENLFDEVNLVEALNIICDIMDKEEL
ncbi:MAG: hypothetical protein AABX38_01420 [Candidatus Micrarchaeota archaeon]